MKAADIRFYFSIFLRWLPLALATACITTAIGTFVAFELSPAYTATATITVETPDLPSELARSTVPQNAIAQVQLAQQSLFEDAPLEALASQLDLHSWQLGSSEEIADAIRENVRIEQIQFGSGDQLIHAFAIEADASDPRIAALIANTLASLFIDNDLDRRQARAASTLSFFQDDVAELAAALRTSETALLTFKTENYAALPESLAFRRSQIGTGRATLLALQEEEANARVRRANLIATARTTGQVGGVVPVEFTMLNDLKSTLSVQLALYALDSPSVTRLQERIRTLELQLTDPKLTPLVTATAPEEVNEIDARLAIIAADKVALGEELKRLEASLLDTPGNESRLRAMELGRDNIQSQYTAAIVRLGEAGAGERVEALIKGERLSLFQAAVAPIYPVNPQRRLIVLGSAFGGFALIASIALLAELFNSRIRRPADLQRKLSIQPLGVIPVFKRGRLARYPWLKPSSGLVPQPSDAMSIDGRPSWTA